MNVENTSTKGVTDVIKVEIKVENESFDEVPSEIDLYADHVVKEEMVIGPVVLQAVDVKFIPEDIPVSKKSKLETTDEETDQVKLEKVKREDNNEEITSNVEFNSTTNIKKCNQTPRGKKIQENDKITHVYLQKKIEFNSPTNIKTNMKKCNQTPRHKKKQENDKIIYVYLKKKFLCSNNQKSQLSHSNPYSCSHCDYKCKIKSNLLRHVRTHTDEKPFSCSHCDYKCKNGSNLSSHLRTHTGEKPYSCSFCEFKCRQKGDLSRHLRIHTGEKPYSCSQCDYKCKRKSYLSSHLLRIHTGEKPYSCFQCDYKCCGKGDLAKHFRIHTDERPFSCAHCEYRSAQKPSLAKHIVRRHTSKISK